MAITPLSPISQHNSMCVSAFVVDTKSDIFTSQKRGIEGGKNKKKRGRRKKENTNK